MSGDLVEVEAVEPVEDVEPDDAGEARSEPAMVETRLKALDGLPVRVRVFVNRYLSNGFRPKDAALAAGWAPASAGQAGTRMLRDARVVAAIDEALEAQGLARIKVLEGLAALSLSDMTDVVTWDDTGRAVFKATDELPDHIRQSITKLKVDPETGRITEIEMGSKVAALTALMKGLRMDKPTVNVNATGPVQVVIQGDDAAVL